jgi:hypothetical protein
LVPPFLCGEKKITVNGEVSFYQNKFNGDPFSSVGFQMLEGLQTGQTLRGDYFYKKNYPIGYQLKLPGPKKELSKLFILETSN